MVLLEVRVLLDLLDQLEPQVPPALLDLLALQDQQVQLDLQEVQVLLDLTEPQEQLALQEI
jgi:hypothetical protein